MIDGFWFPFFVFLGACGAAAATGAMFPPGRWYVQLNKPVWVPPNWLFPVAWSSIYLLISFAGARIVHLEGSGVALMFWALQIAFNTLWTPIFFGLRHFRASLIVMAFLWLSVSSAMLAHFYVDVYAGLAFVPYFLWVSVAGMLNIAMYRLNPNIKPLKPADLD